jgi:hypothetical protein
MRLALPLPANDGEFTLVIAHSVFTHLSKAQTEYYLSEVKRVLAPGGMAFTSWFFFDRASFPFLPEVYCLYTSESDFSQAVLFDREWFMATIRNLGLGVRTTRRPWIPGHQWKLFLVPRTPDMHDHFPLGEDGADWVCGASAKRIAEPPLPPEIAATIGRTAVRLGSSLPGPPPLFGVLAELDRIKRSWAWMAGRALTSPLRAVRKLFSR